ncbi:MAG TPA: hypothetical protein VFP58_13350 [Candidatus Eisenbacteria bacterium]|nr:hypothetical protein [Candidatus Eisenbacteria bacterium]
MNQAIEPGGRWQRVLLGPVVVAIVLALPTFSFPFLWDDFDFLGRTQVLELRELAPDPHTLYYRPVSREIYFGLVHLLGSHPSVAHILNLAGVLGIVCLLFACTRELAGMRAAAMAALLFSGLGALPLLTGWISTIQDVLAILFTMAALLAEIRGRRAWALGLWLVALLSKETALSMAPALVVAAWMRTPLRSERIRVLGTYALATAVWLLIHPATRLLLFGGGNDGASGTIGVSSETFSRSLMRGTLATWNIPLGSSTPGPRTLLFAGLTAIVVSVISILRLRRETKQEGPRLVRPAIWLSLWMWLPPLVMVAALVPVWSHYYACFPALGVCMAGGVCLARAPRTAAVVLVAAYITLGVWSRTVGLEPEITTESNLRRSAASLRTVELNFKKLRPSFPPGSTVYVSAQLSGPAGMHTLLYRFQPLRIWYREPSLYVLDPNRYRQESKAEYLFWLNRQLDVIEIDLRTFTPRSSGALPDLFAYQKTMRTFALGRAAGGRANEAVHILIGMQGRPPIVEVYDRRAAAAILIEAGRRSEAEALVRDLPSFSRENALEAAFSILHEPAPGLDLDDAVMEAFGLSPREVEANRLLMRAFDQNGFADSAMRFAERVARLIPEDREAEEVRRKWSSKRALPQITVPIPHS